MADKETLLRQYFTENKQEIPDGGFTHRVMHRLPGRGRRAGRRIFFWNFTGYTIAAVLFVALGGIEAVCAAVVRIFEQTAQNTHYNLRTLVIVMAVLIFLLCRKVCSLR